jgi:hypothetical protein
VGGGEPVRTSILDTRRTGSYQGMASAIRGKVGPPAHLHSLNTECGTLLPVSLKVARTFALGLAHMTRRVAAQRSRFIIFGTDPQWLANMGKKKDSRLVSITIPRGSINGIKPELRDAGVTESVVYPDLNGLGRELEQVWKARR